MEALTGGLARVCVVRLPKWGPRDFTKQWLETVGDVAQCSSQRLSGMRNLSSSV